MPETEHPTVIDAVDAALAALTVLRKQLDPDRPEIPERDLEDLGLTTRCLNCLQQAGCVSLADIATFSEIDLMTLENFGKHTLAEVKSLLASYGLRLARHRRAAR